MTTLTYHTGSDSSPIVNVRDANGNIIDFSTATRFVATFNGTDTSNNFTVDTSITAGAITGDALGNLTFVFAALELTEDTYMLNLVVYDASHTNGQQLADECCGPYLSMKVCGSVAITPCAAANKQLNVWEFTQASTEDDYDLVAYGNGVFLIGDGDDRLRRSTDDGATFSLIVVPNWFSTTLGATYSETDGRWLLVGGGGYYSTSDDDGATWANGEPEGSSEFNACHYANGLYVMAGVGGVMYTSPTADSGSWTVRTSSFAGSEIESVNYGNSIWVACGLTGKIASSPDGITWTQRTSNLSATAWNVMFGNGVFIVTASGAQGMSTSTDGITWTNPVVTSNANPPFPFETDNFLHSGTYLADQLSFIVGSWTDPIIAISSDDGATWNLVATPGGLYDVAYGNTWLVASVNGAGIWRTQVA